VVAQLRQQLAGGRQPHALEVLGVVADQQFGGVPAEDDRRLLSDLETRSPPGGAGSTPASDRRFPRLRST
jgi:hypothetical protein